MGLIPLGVWDAGEVGTSPEVIRNEGRLFYDHPPAEGGRSKKCTSTRSEPLSQTPLKSLLNPARPFPTLAWFPKYPPPFPLHPHFLQASHWPPFSLQPSPGLLGLLVTIKLRLAFLALTKIYWPSPAQPDMPRAWLCRRPGKIKAEARWCAPTSATWAEADLVARGSWSEAMSTAACRRERKLWGLLHIPCPHCPNSGSDHLPQEIVSATEVPKQEGKRLATLLLSAHSLTTHPQACLPGPRLRSGY